MGIQKDPAAHSKLSGANSAQAERPAHLYGGYPPVLFGASLSSNFSKSGLCAAGGAGFVVRENLLGQTSLPPASST